VRIFQTEDGTEYNSFLECLNDQKFTAKDLDLASIAEFLIYGQLHREATFLKSVTKHFTHQPYRLDINNGLTENSIGSGNPLQNRPSNSLKKDQKKFLLFFEDRAVHLNDRKLSIDLTGGIDSRLIASILHALDVKFDALFSMISGDENELHIVHQLCNKLDVDLHVIREENLIDEKELDALYQLSDGLWNPLKIRSLSKAQKWRKSQNYDLAITGVGGELYKDFFWQQNFPFYTSRKHHFERLNRLRMYPSMMPEEWIGVKFRNEYTNFQNSFVSNLKRYQKKYNTQTYDQIYYQVRVKETTSALSKMSSNYLPVYSPLLEPELLEIGYNLKRRHRFFNYFHRSLITNCTPEIAKIPTTEGGVSVSVKGNYVFKDLFRYGVNKSNSLYSKVIGKRFTSPPTHSDFEMLSATIEDSIKRLKQAEILSGAAPVSALSYPDEIAGRLLSLSKLIEQLKK